jgi:uncharacterized protein (DUF433 family)
MQAETAPPITIEAQALAEVLAGGLLAGTPADFARTGKAFRAAMNPRDDSEQLQVDLAMLAVYQFRQVARGLMDGPLTPLLLKAQVEAAKLLDRSMVHLKALRLRKAEALDVARPSPEAALRRAREEAAQDCTTPDPQWMDVMRLDHELCHANLGTYPLLRGTKVLAFDVIEDLNRGWPMERFFLEHPTLTAADVRAALGCWQEIRCRVDKPVPPDPDMRHIPRYDLGACVYGRGLKKEEVRFLEYTDPQREYLRTEQGARAAWGWKRVMWTKKGIAVDLDRLAGFHVPSPEELDEAAEAARLAAEVEGPAGPS